MSAKPNSSQKPEVSQGKLAMASKKTEHSDGEDLVYHRHPDGRLEEMTKAQAAGLEKKQSSVAGRDEVGDWTEKIKTRSE